MISFSSDYVTGAHPKVLKALTDTNLEFLPGYETDEYCQRAAEKILKACSCPDGQVFFLAGGTQTNQVVIDTVLAPYEGVISAKTGHINAHEAGAVEFTGHKVIEIQGYDGRLKASDVEAYLSAFYADENHEHMVFPGMVYISMSTEYGTIYSKAELEALHNICANYDIPLFIDGARLGYALCSRECDVTLPEMAKLCDVFYAGGTKMGALCGEAVVFTHDNAPDHFITRVKQHGAMLAKGRLLGVQFDALFTDNLYFEIGNHAIEMAEKVKNMFARKGYRFFINSPTNQQFVILENSEMAELKKNVEFSYWEPYDENHTVVRFATTWSTTDEHLDYLESLLKNQK